MVCSILKTSSSFFILRVSKHETSGQTSEESTSHGVSFRSGNPDDMPNAPCLIHAHSRIASKPREMLESKITQFISFLLGSQ